jgi:acetyl esterase
VLTTKGRTVTVLAVGMMMATVVVPVVASAPAGAAVPVTVESNLCYQPSHAACVDGSSHQFDAYLPSGGTQKAPGVILVHGGGFIGGDKSTFAAIATKLAGDGFAAFSVNYRLDSSTVAGFPMESQDVMAAISYVRAHARSFHVDPDRLGSFGSSAGATLVVYSAMKAYQSDPSARVLADVGWSGGYDFTVGTSGAVDPQQLRNAEYSLGCSDPTDPGCAATAVAASAVSLVQAGDPATLLANSTDYQVGCEIVAPSQAQGMAAALTAAGVPVQLDLNGACAHAVGYANVELAPTIAFLEAHLFEAPTITSRDHHRFREGTAGTFTVKAKADPTATLVESGALPAGVTFVDQGDGRGVLGGTPETGTAGTYPITLAASNGGYPDAVQQFTLVVAAARR